MRSGNALLGPILAVCLLAGPALGQAMPQFSDTGPDAADYGAALGYPVIGRGQAIGQGFMVGSYSHFDTVYPTHVVAGAIEPTAWRRTAQEIPVAYTFHQQAHTVQDYLARNPTTGLLIARRDTVLFEHYQYGRTDHDRFMSQSMAKTIVAMLVGIAVAEHAIRSIDDLAGDYVPEMAATELGRTPIRALLHMASGIAFTETYDGNGDNAVLGRDMFARNGPGPVAALSRFNTRVAAPDTQWHYAGLNTEMLGLVLARAARMPIAQYLETRIWQPMGAEAQASWTTDSTGQEIAYCCFNAVLRDYARFGRLLAQGGAIAGRQIIPRQWVIDATAPPEPDSFLDSTHVGNGGGYGYQIWLLGGSRGGFMVIGVHGQRLFVDPVSGLVLVHTAVRVAPTRSPGDAELIAIWNSLLRNLPN